MPHDSKEVEATREASQAGFATLGRAIADTIRGGGDAAALVREASLRRWKEYEIADKGTMFAALARQVGDAAMNGRDITTLIDALTILRRKEIG